MHSYSALLGASLFTLLLLLAIVIVTLVGKWKVYALLGMPGWYSPDIRLDEIRKRLRI